MKKLLIFAIAFISFQSLKAQKQGAISLNAYGGYTFKDKVNFDGFYGYVDEAFQYGGGLEFFVRENRSFEVKYLRMDTHFPVYLNGGTKLNEGADQGSISYLLFGGNNYFGGHPDSKAVPYAGADLGIGFVDMKDGGSSTKFGWDVKLGVKLKTSSVIALKLQAYVQSVIAAVGSDIYVTGGGALVGVPNYATIFQFGLGGALVFDFKKK